MSINPCPTEQLYFPVLVHNVDILISCPCNKIMKKMYISMSIHIYMFWNVHIKGGSHKMCHLFRYLEVILLMIYNFFCHCCLFSIFFNSFIMSPPMGRHIVFVLSVCLSGRPSVCPSHSLSAQLLWNYWAEFHETW